MRYNLEVKSCTRDLG